MKYLYAGLCLLLPAGLQAHGTLEWPKSRVKRVYEALSQSPRPSWAAQAVALDGEQPYYTWNQLSRNFPAAVGGDSGPYVAGIPDGQLAGAGNTPSTASLPGHPGLSFSGLDTASPLWEWPATTVTAGIQSFTFYATAPHDPSFFKVWITRAGYDVHTPLRWQDLDYLGQPAHTKSGNNYQFPVNLPARTGRAVVCVAWQRIDPAGEVFFAAADVDFGGGSDPAATPVAGFVSQAISVNENAGTASATIALSKPAPAGGVSVMCSSAVGTAGPDDFTAVSSTLTFASGETQKSLLVPIANDTIAESGEVFILTLSNPAGATLGQAAAQVTILDDDAPPSSSGGYRFVITQNWGSGWEGKLELTNAGAAAWSPWTLEFDAPYTISNAYNGISAGHAGNHYIYGPQSWNGTIPAGGSLVFDWLVSNSGGLPATAPTSVRINGQLLAMLEPGVAIESITADEGDSSRSQSMTISLESPHTSPVSAAWQTLSGTAVTGDDFTTAGGTVTFAPGETVKSISITVAGDTTPEGDESFTVALAGVSGQPVPRFVSGKQSATVTLRDDDGPPFVWVTGGSVVEASAGTRPLPFRLWLSRPAKAGETIRADYRTVNDSALAADGSTPGMTCQCQAGSAFCDYIHATGTVTFPAGATSVTVPVQINGDTRDEDLELFQFQISNLSGCTARNTGATGQIIDDDMPAAKVSAPRRVVAYADATAGTVNLPPGERLTHLFAAFANIGTDGALAQVPAISSWNSLKSTNPALRILLSVGGWNWSGAFTAMAADPAKRAAFANSCRSVVQQQNLDGIDLDWEWPGGGNTSPLPGDRAHFTALVHAVRTALNDLSLTTGKTYELTCYAPATAANLAFWDLAALKQDFDFFNVQSYDLHGPWDSITGHQSGLAPNPSKADGLDIASVLNLYTNAGVPRSQLLLGAPFYAYYWTGVGPAQNGFNQPGGGASDLTYASLTGTDGWAGRFIRTWDAYAQVPSLYEPSTTGTGRWVSYDDPQSILAKARFCRDGNFGGVFFWQLGGDSSDRQLLTTLSDSLAEIPETDTDGDQLPDAWEFAHFGSLTKASSATDSDGDGTGDLLEFRARTLPADARDHLQLSVEFHPGESRPMLCLPTAARVSYRVQRSLNLTTWSDMTTLEGTGGSVSTHDTTLPANAARAFYRISIP